MSALLAFNYVQGRLFRRQAGKGHFTIKRKNLVLRARVYMLYDHYDNLEKPCRITF